MKVGKKIGVERIKGLQRQGLFCEITKLLGLEEIAYVLNWSRTKLKSKLDELQNAGVIFRDWHGMPPACLWCSFPSLILRYVSLKGEKREVL